LPRPAGPGKILQPSQPVQGEPAPPFAHRGGRHAQVSGDPLVSPAAGGSQHDLRPQPVPVRRLRAPHLWVPKTLSLHVTWAYSRIRPPSPVPAENPDVCAWSRRMRTPGRAALVQCPVPPLPRGLADIGTGWRPGRRAGSAVIPARRGAGGG